MTPSLRLRLIRWAARTFQKPMLERAKEPGFARFRTEIAGRVFLRGRAPFAYRSDVLGGVPVRRLPTPGARGTLFYIHGGGFVFFSARTHQGIAALLARPLWLEPVVVDYARAPEAPFPAAIDDVTAAYGALRPPIVIAGDSAGGGLALSLLNRILVRGLSRPAAVLAFSPWADLTLSGESLAANADAEPLLPAGKLGEVAAGYLNGADPRSPDASPVFGRFAGAPPVLIQAVADEILLSDAQAMAGRLETDGAPVMLQILEHGIHAFQPMIGWMPEAGAAVADAIGFAALHLDGVGGGPAPPRRAAESPRDT